MNSSYTNTKRFILSSLTTIGVEQHTLNSISGGAEMYGPAGVLDSVHLVGLISEIADVVEASENFSENLFDILDAGIFNYFKDLSSAAEFLDERFAHVKFPS